MTSTDLAIPINTGRFAKTRTLPFGLFAYVGAGASLLVCYGKAVLLATIGVLGIAVPDPNPHIQAVLMWAFGSIAVYGLIQDRKIHRRNYPVVLGMTGVFVIVAALYAYYDMTIEVTGYILLLAAAFLNQNIFLQQLNKQCALQSGKVTELNDSLERRVDQQVREIERLGRLKRFLAPEIARLVTEEQEKSLFQSHRAFIATVFCDLRGFTAFSRSMEPEEVMGVLQTYHQQIGQLVAVHGGTIDHRAGDGLMVFFNDPIPCDAPVLKAVQLALDMHRKFEAMNEEWKKRGYDLGFGVGIACGYATLGVVGYEGRYDYTANGNAVNLAARLCDEATDGQTLICRKAQLEVGGLVEVEPVADLKLKGFSDPIGAFNVLGEA